MDFSTVTAVNRLAKDAHSERGQVLEDLFVLELMVTSEMCGFSPEERRAWAMQSVLSPEQAEHYIAAWKRARSAAWKRLNSLADDLRRTCGDDRTQWEARLARLESCAAENLRQVPPLVAAASPVPVGWPTAVPRDRHVATLQDD